MYLLQFIKVYKGRVVIVKIKMGGLEDLPLVSPKGVSGNYVLMGVSPKKSAPLPAGKFFENGNPTFVRIAPKPASFDTFDTIAQGFFHEFYRAFNIDVGSFLSDAGACKDSCQRNEKITLCQNVMSQVPYEAHVLSWGELIWHDEDPNKPRIEIFRFEHEAFANNEFDAYLKILDLPLKSAAPGSEISYRIRKFQHQIIDHRE